MLYMVTERFRDIKAIGERFRDRGRMLPDGVVYHASWMDITGASCFQIMETSDRSLLHEWMRNWEDLVEFEVTEVVTSSEFWNKH